MKYIQVAVNVPQVAGIFDYHLPPDLEETIQAGSLVIVPFGSQTVQGIVVDRIEQPSVEETKPVLSILEARPVVTDSQMKLARWMAAETLSPLAECLSLMIPPGLRQHADTLYQVTAVQEASKGLTVLQQRLINVLQKRGSLRGRQIDAAVPRVEWRKPMQGLIRQGLVVSQAVLPPPGVHPKFIRTAQLAISPEVVENFGQELGKGNAGERRLKALNFLIDEPWPVNVSWVYASSGCNLSDLQVLSEKGLVILGESEIWRDPLADIQVKPETNPVLTREQETAWEKLRAGIEANCRGEPARPFLLHGITGSGKTELYLRAVSEILDQGQQAIVMVPEISLTPQTIRRFMARFPGRVGLTHSQLSPGERYDTWRRVRDGLIDVIVGPRSALFAPLPRPGLVVVDECHDESYYQNESTPFFNSITAALTFAEITGSTILLGSATPDVIQYFRARKEGWNQLTLTSRIPAGKNVSHPTGKFSSGFLELPPVRIVDMRQELINGNRSIFSSELQRSLSGVLNAGQQAILFLNRRGSSTYVFCRDCGFVLKCPNCEVPLTYHGQEDLLLCHTCNYSRQMPQSCPQCGGTHIRQYGTGTEKVEEELIKRFPGIRTLRWDYETTRQKGAHDIILSHFSRHQADVLIGTQMLAKGLDFPLVTLVGVILADVGLNLPDYRSAERTFQLLTQVAGRAGRSPLGGQAIFQTYMPEHYAILAAAQHDVNGFLQKELEYRRLLKLPPYYRLLRLEYRHLQESSAEESAREMAGQLIEWIQQGNHHATEVVGPAPCFFSRQNRYYRWQIVLRGPNPVEIIRDKALPGWRLEVDPPNLL